MGEGKQGTPSFLTTGFPWSHPCHLGKCICMYMYACMYLFRHMYVYTYAHLCVCLHVYMLICMCLYMCTHVLCVYIIYMRMYVYIHVYMCVCICMCICMYMCMLCFRETCQVQSVCLQGHGSHFIGCQNLTVADLSNTRSKPAGIRGPVDLCPPVFSLLCSGDFWY